MTRQRPVSASDRAASAYSPAPSAMAAFTSALASMRSCRSGISRTRASSKTSPAPKFVSVLKPGKGWCRFSCPGLASFASIRVRHRSSQPRMPSTADSRADEADGDVAGRGRGVRVGRAVHGDAVARVDVPVPGPEFQLRLADDVRFHAGRSHRPASRPLSAGAGAGGSGGGSHAFSSIAASASTVSRLPNRIRSSRLLNKVSSPCR